MKITNKCYHCGKEYPAFTYKTVSEVISCSHCHKSMRIDKATNRKYQTVRFVLVMLFCFVIMSIMALISTNIMLNFAVVMIAAVLLAGESDRICLFVTNKLFGLSYEEYHPETLRALEKEEEREKQKRKQKKEAAKAEKKLNKK